MIKIEREFSLKAKVVQEEKGKSKLKLFYQVMHQQSRTDKC